jgi:hypothetical protein
VNQRNGTNIVDIVAITSDPGLPRAIVTAHADRYMELAIAEISKRSDAELAEYEARLASLRARLAEVDAAIAESVKPFLPDPASGVARPIPNLEQLVPELASERSTLLSQYEQLRGVRTQAELAAASAVPPSVIEPGTAPVIVGRRALMVVGPVVVVAGLGGVFLAVLLARLSRRVLDAEEVAETVGVPLAGRIPGGLAAFRKRSDPQWVPPSQMARFLDELCTRAEAAPRAAEALTVLVTATEPRPDSVALAAAMAGRFARVGMEVALVDADPRATALYGSLAGRHLTLSEAFALHDAPAAETDRPDERLVFVGIADDADAVALRRNRPERVLAALGHMRDVVVVAGAPLLQAGTSVQLAQRVDVVVLVVAVDRQDRRRLDAVIRTIEGRSGQLLVVDGRDAPTPRRARGNRELKSSPAGDRTTEDRDAQPGVTVR